MSWEILPDDVLLKIKDQEEDDVKGCGSLCQSIRSVCRGWRKAIDMHITKLWIGDLDGFELQFVADRIGRFPRLSSVGLTFKHLNKEDGYDRQSLPASICLVSSNMTGLQQLDLRAFQIKSSHILGPAKRCAWGLKEERSGYPVLQALCLRDCQLPREGLELTCLKTLTRLDLSYTYSSSTGYASCISRLSSLESLDISFSGLVVQDLAQLKDLTRLTKLRFFFSRPASIRGSMDCLDIFVRLLWFPLLQNLSTSIFNSDFSQAQAAAFKDVAKRLTWLALAGMTLDLPTWVRIASFPKLANLLLYGQKPAPPYAAVLHQPYQAQFISAFPALIYVSVYEVPYGCGCPIWRKYLPSEARLCWSRVELSGLDLQNNVPFFSPSIFPFDEDLDEVARPKRHR